jgi:5-deoxy-glucuronate isomerase
VAVCGAKASTRHTPAVRHVTADEVPVELRGAGQMSREVRNFGVPGVLDADRIIACEVITPGGNWSSYPPHKHDEERVGVETELEEIYYFEVQQEVGTSVSDADPIAYQRVYGTADRPIDVLAEVRSGDVVLVPHGWHGPAMAVPGYDLYYLNVMAGPGEQRAWLICDDPAHGWIRDTWADQPVDPRLPLGGASHE